MRSGPKVGSRAPHRNSLAHGRYVEELNEFSFQQLVDVDCRGVLVCVPTVQVSSWGKRQLVKVSRRATCVAPVNFDALKTRTDIANATDVRMGGAVVEYSSDDSSEVATRLSINSATV